MYMHTICSSTTVDVGYYNMLNFISKCTVHVLMDLRMTQMSTVNLSENVVAISMYGWGWLTKWISTESSDHPEYKYTCMSDFSSALYTCFPLTTG